MHVTQMTPRTVRQQFTLLVTADLMNKQMHKPRAGKWQAIQSASTTFDGHNIDVRTRRRSSYALMPLPSGILLAFLATFPAGAASSSAASACAAAAFRLDTRVPPFASATVLFSSLLEPGDTPWVLPGPALLATPFIGVVGSLTCFFCCASQAAAFEGEVPIAWNTQS
jgi:hypothetical protein